MATSRLPLDIKRLLTDHIDSVGQLEVLLVFLNNPEKKFKPQQMALELRSHETAMSQQMEKLFNSGFLAKNAESEYFYSPKNEELAKQVEDLRTAYKEMSVAVIAFIYEKPTDKLKGFADAFRLKKD